jgi:hypothetical protein
MRALEGGTRNKGQQCTRRPVTICRIAFAKTSLASLWLNCFYIRHKRLISKEKIGLTCDTESLFKSGAAAMARLADLISFLSVSLAAAFGISFEYSLSPFPPSLLPLSN